MPRDTTASCLAQVRAYLNDARAPKNEQALCFNLCGAASQDFSGDAVRMLLLSGAPVNGRDGAMSALIWAAGSGNAAAVRMLLDAGADPLALTADTGECALSLAIAHSGALGPPRPARADFLGVREALARKRDTTCATVGGRRQSAVYLAAHFGADAMLKALLASGAEADDLTGSPARRSALFEAVMVPISCDQPSCKVSRGELLDLSFRMVKRLLAAGAHTRLRDMTSLLPVRGVAVTADLRVADAIFAAEAARGLLLTSDAEHGPGGCAPGLHAEANWLRGVAEAVEAFRAGGPAVLPEALRQRTMQVLDSSHMNDLTMSASHLTAAERAARGDGRPVSGFRLNFSGAAGGDEVRVKLTRPLGSRPWQHTRLCAVTRKGAALARAAAAGRCRRAAHASA